MVVQANKNKFLYDLREEQGDGVLAPLLNLEEVDDVLDPATVRHFLRLGLAAPDHAVEPALRHAHMPPGEQVVNHGHLREKLDVLEGSSDAHRGDIVGPGAHDRRALPADVTLLRAIHLADGVEDRGLAGPVRTDDREQLAGVHVEGHVADGGHTAEPQRDVFDFEDGISHRAVSSAQDNQRLRRL